MKALRHLTLAVLLSLVATPVSAFEPTKVPVSPKGTPAVIDIPTNQHMRNTGGSDGAGLCVFTSVTVAARWQNLPDMLEFREWAEKRPGGSLPNLLDADLKEYAREKGIKLPGYIQHVGGDVDFLRLTLATRRMPGVTYSGFDDFYGYRGRIYHMVNLMHADGKEAAILDNNHPGEWYWMSHGQAMERWQGRGSRRTNDPDKLFAPFRVFPAQKNFGIADDFLFEGDGDGWAFVWTAPPPPPIAIVGPPAQPRKIVWEKRDLENVPTWFAWENGSLLGVYDWRGWHRALSNDSWLSEVSIPPTGITPPDEAFPVEAPCCPKCPDCKTPRFWIDGVEADPEQARAALLTDLTDDSNKYHLSFVGLDRETVEAWFKGPLSPYVDRLHVQVYSADNWVAKTRLGSIVTLQEPAKAGGRIIRKWDSFEAPTADKVRQMLASVFDAPTPKPVDPVIPAPVDPVVPVEPVEPVEPSKIRLWWLLVIGFLTYLFARRA